MLKSPFEPCIPTPSRCRTRKLDPRIKHDGYRLIVQREGQRVQLLIRNGHDWSGWFPLITEPTLAAAAHAGWVHRWNSTNSSD